MYSKAKSTEVDNVEILYDINIGLMKCQFGLGNLNEVKAYVLEAEKLKPNVDLFMFAANVSFKTQDFKDCVENCKKALKVDPNYTHAKNLMSTAL